MKPLRCSPLADLHTVGENIIHAGMAVPAGGGLATLPPVVLADFSMLPKFGCKGPVAAEWLSSAGLPLPESSNHWLPHHGGLIARLGSNEYFMEAGTDTDWVTPMMTAEQLPDLTPVLRHDASLLLAGSQVNDLLLQVCSYNFSELDVAARPLVMTLIVGVSVVVVPLPGAVRTYRLWCDPTLAPYLYRTLLAIAHELDGTAIGLRDVADHLPGAIASGFSAATS